MEEELESVKISNDKRFLRPWVNPYLRKIFSIPDKLLDSSLINLKERIFKKASEFENLYVEPCSGSGGHLIKLASNNPKDLFIGFEKRYKRAFRTAEKARELKNLIVVRGNVDLALFPDGLVAGVYLNFPDPWDKNEKNRLINEGFVREVYRILRKDGFFRLKTDHKESFLRAKDAFSGGGFVTISEIMGASLEESGIQTEFESLFRSKNLPIYLLSVKKNQ
jgi:tRNA (guanine-N7-)-methyltransferase